MKKAFCKRNLKPVFALLVVLMAATIVWAIVSKRRESNRVGRPATDLAYSADPSSAAAALPLRRVEAAAPAAKAGRAEGASAGGARADAASPNGTVEWTPATGRLMNVGNRMVDAVSIATPRGGINVIAQPGTRSPSAGFGTPGAPARMQLAAAGPGSRHAFSTVSSLILPSVVGIHATRNQLADRALAPGGGLRFEDPFNGVPDKFARNRAYESVGSGFITDSRGYVLTNYHVISQTTDLLVSVAGGINKDFPATVVAVDPVADLALIKVSGAPVLPEAQLGDSHSVQTGDWVLAFGSPFGFEQTVTQGIISSKRKSLVVEGISYGDMLQTDAPTNQGSSGGPLADLRAEVVGINTAIYGPDGGFSGTGFAIPVDRASAFLARCSHVLQRRE